MPESVILKHYAKRITTFNKYYKKTVKNKRESDIHDLRLSIKKLRATWSLMDVVTRGLLNKQVHNELFRKLFKSAGRVREAQVNIMAVDKLNLKYLTAYREYQLGLQKKAEKKMQSVLKSFNHDCFKILDRHWRQSVRKIPEALIFEHSWMFINRELDKVRQLVKGLPHSDNLHEIRIILKAVHEVISILSKLGENANINSLGKKIKNINEEIGQWHDTLVLLESLEKYSERKMKSKEKKFLLSFIPKLHGREKGSQQGIQDKLETFFEQHPDEVIKGFVVTDNEIDQDNNAK